MLKEQNNKLAKARKTRTSPGTLGLKKFGLGGLGRPETLTGWKSESITYGPTDRLTWVGARDTCVSKNRLRGNVKIFWQICY